MTSRFTDRELQVLLQRALPISRKAGKILMQYYKSDDLETQTKEDNSPVTIADKKSSELIVTELRQLTPDIAVVSEENDEMPNPKSRLYWSVDPLDGTKGFISKNDHFYVKIALIEHGVPILGFIHEPVYERTYHSARNMPAMRMTPQNGETIIEVPPPNHLRLKTVFNSLHCNIETYDAARADLAQRGLTIPMMEDAGGMCKTAFYMAVATGEADLFINCGTNPGLQGANGFSWDYAPDCLILHNAGGVMIDLTTGHAPRFDHPRKKMNAMIGLNNKDLGKKLFPELKNDCI